MIYKDDCPCERYIPIYQIVSGSFGIFKALLDAAVAIKKKLSKEIETMDDSTDLKKNGTAIGSLIGCFMFAWFIAGSLLFI